MGRLSYAHPGVLRLLHFQYPLGSGKVVQLFKGFNLPQEGLHGRILHGTVLCCLPLLPTGHHSMWVNRSLRHAPKAAKLGRRGRLGRTKGRQFAREVEVVSWGQWGRRGH